MNTCNINGVFFINKYFIIVILISISALTLFSSCTADLYDAARKGDVWFIKHYKGNLNQLYEYDKETALMISWSMKKPKRLKR